MYFVVCVIKLQSNNLLHTVMKDKVLFNKDDIMTSRVKSYKTYMHRDIKRTIIHLEVGE